MSHPESTMEIAVDPTNPGHFFACCGLLELADRMTGRADGCFAGGRFSIRADTNLPTLVRTIVGADLVVLDANDDKSSSLLIREPFNLRIDWWKFKERGVSGLKVWAGTMAGPRIALAMQKAMVPPEPGAKDLLDQSGVVFDPNDLSKKVEPFYFDSHRGPNAHSRDVGFSANDLGLKTAASPATEFLCLVGLQRARPVPVKERARRYRYFTWNFPVPPALLPAAVAGHLGDTAGYEFESWYRTGQKKHKAFLTANLLP